MQDSSRILGYLATLSWGVWQLPPSNPGIAPSIVSVSTLSVRGILCKTIRATNHQQHHQQHSLLAESKQLLRCCLRRSRGVPRTTRYIPVDG